MFNLPEEFKTLDGRDVFSTNLYSKGVYEVERAALQIKTILESMSPYSLVKLVKAVDNGMVEGRVYTNQNWDDAVYPLEKTFPQFQGCLLGWGGFLEQVGTSAFARRFRDIDYTSTAHAEHFVSNIHSGDTPGSNSFSRRLREIVEFELGERGLVLNVPAKTGEKVEVA